VGGTAEEPTPPQASNKEDMGSPPAIGGFTLDDIAGLSTVVGIIVSKESGRVLFVGAAVGPNISSIQLALLTGGLVAVTGFSGPLETGVNKFSSKDALAAASTFKYNQMCANC
jgi:hypothetical protein